MVTIKDYHLRTSKEGKVFISLELQGDVEMVQSMETGRFYATAKRCSVSSTFDEETAKKVLGTRMPGRIIRSECAEYEYAIPETGEVIKLAHTYQYQPEEYHAELTPSSVVVPTLVQA
jgi:hypothetical protein